MTIHAGSITHKREFFEGLPQRASEAARRLGAELLDARRYENPDLSASALAAESGRRVQSTQNAASAEVTTQRAEATDALGYLDRVLDAERPRITDYARAQASWQQAKMYLDNGHTLRHVLANADQALTLAVEEFGPHYLRAQRDPSKLWELRFDTAGHTNATDAAVAELRSAVLRRLADLATDPALADLIRTRLAADPSVSGASGWWKALDAVAAGRAFDGLHAAAVSRVAEQHRAAQLMDATPRAAHG